MNPQFRPWLHIPFTNLWIGKLENAMLFTLMAKKFDASLTPPYHWECL